jgi:hypothetical protein
VQELRLRAVNRRGRHITCAITVTPLRGVHHVDGAILLMDEEPASPA